MSGLSSAFHDLFDLVLLGDRAHRADGRALAALHAGHGGQVVVEGRADDRLEAAVLREQRADVLRLGADAHAAAALDALAAVARAGPAWRLSIRRAGLLAGEGDLADAQLGGQRLQLAVLVAVAGLALAVVLGEQQLDDRRGGPGGRGGVLVKTFMPGAGRHGAGGGQVAGPLDLDHAHPAGADRLQALDVAERGDADARLPGRTGGRGPSGTSTGTLLIERVIIDCVIPGSLWDHGLRVAMLLSRRLPLTSAPLPERDGLIASNGSPSPPGWQRRP